MPHEGDGKGHQRESQIQRDEPRPVVYGPNRDERNRDDQPQASRHEGPCASCAVS